MKFPRDVIINDRDLKRLPANKQFLVVAGAQGQPTSNLFRIASDAHKMVTLTDLDTVIISADPIPGRENDVNKLIDQIYRHGARVSYSDIMEDLHVSGHGSSGDMMLLLLRSAPNMFGLSAAHISLPDAVPPARGGFGIRQAGTC